MITGISKYLVIFTKSFKINLRMANRLLIKNIFLFTLKEPRTFTEFPNKGLFMGIHCVLIRGGRYSRLFFDINDIGNLYIYVLR